MYFVVCYIVLTDRGNLKLPKAKRSTVLLFYIATHDQLSDLTRSMWYNVYRYHYGYSLPINVYFQIEFVAQWL